MSREGPEIDVQHKVSASRMQAVPRVDAAAHIVVKTLDTCKIQSLGSVSDGERRGPAR